MWVVKIECQEEIDTESHNLSCLFIDPSIYLFIKLSVFHAYTHLHTYMLASGTQSCKSGEPDISVFCIFDRPYLI